MISKNTFNLFLSFLLLVIIVSCKEEKRTIQEIDFTSEYKLNQQIQDKVHQDTVPWKYQISASDYATKGAYKNALNDWDIAMGGREQSYTPIQIDSIHKKHTQINASKYIIEQAKQTQVVIINEAHHNSSHRVFTKSLLKDLYQLGYRNLGLEALASGKFTDSLLNKRGYPIQKSGYYIKDPQFGDLVRTALQIGYTVFPYEQTTNVNGKQREIEQAKNIQKAIQAKPNEKFLIHCGFDHALEGTHSSWEKAMAGRITEYTGINPLTINQVVYSEKGNPAYNHPLLKALTIKESSVIIDTLQNPLKYERGEAWSDIAVFHPNTTYINGRPNWLFDRDHQPTIVTLDDLIIEYPVMVLAYAKGEDIATAIPLDITEVENNTADAHLSLKKGTYAIVVTNGKKSYTFDQIVN